MEAREIAYTPSSASIWAPRTPRVGIISAGKPSIVKERGEAIPPLCVGIDDSGTVIVGQ